MDKVTQAIKQANEAFALHSPDEYLQDGESFATVFNDCVLIVRMDKGKLRFEFLMGKPMMIDFTVFDENE